ncbi:MAG: translation initiation factor IF-2, partial [Alphaproteobacteria bacterium]|nr:translation initiation factor IF-2 [Alphaproteobacteria bacterium]
KLGTKLSSSASRGGIEVEVIKKRRVFSNAGNTSETSTVQTVSKQEKEQADKLKSILENARKLEEQSKLEAEKEAEVERERQALIEKERKEQEELQKQAQEVLEETKTEEVETSTSVAPTSIEEKQEPVEKVKYKKNKDAYEDDDDDEEMSSNGKKKSSDKNKSSKKFSDRKMNFSNVVVSNSDLDFDDDDEQEERSASLTSAMEFVGTHQHRRSFASIKRQKEKNYRKFMEHQEHQEPKEVQKTYHEVILPETISVKDLAIRMAEKSSDVIKTMMKLGIMATINQVIDADTAELIVMEFGHTVKRVSDADTVTSILKNDTEEAVWQSRPPVVTVMGHVDHGKTSLLDAFRQTDVVSGEAGGITQHIGAYQITNKNGRKITFIDTPGHEAFSAMRARGVNVTDIVILVVAANDGIMPQTIEAINHAKAAKVPMIVAINKIDLPEANPEKVRMDLLQQGLVVEKLGGDVLDIEISAKKKLNLDKLEELLLLQADVLELKGNIAGHATGAVIEAKMEQGRGSTATVLVQKGILKKGDIFVSGSSVGRVRELLDEFGRKVQKAEPSQPVVVLGFEGTPVAGDDFVVVESDAKAREVAEYRKRKEKERQMVAKKSNWQELFQNIKEGKAETLPVIIKADTQGSAEAIADSLLKIKSEKVKVQVMHSGVGAINESDITLAKTTGAVVLGFNVRANTNAKDQAKHDDVDIRYYSVIYNMIDDVKVLMSGLLAPVIKENFIGYADVLQVFNAGKAKAAGCKVTEGIVKKGCGVRMLRDNVVIFEGKLAQLKRMKEDVKEVRSGMECGISFENFNDILPGDRLECFETEEIKATL